MSAIGSNRVQPLRLLSTTMTPARAALPHGDYSDKHEYDDVYCLDRCGVGFRRLKA